MENITKDDLDKVAACAGTLVREPERSELKAIYEKLEFVCKSLPKDQFVYKIRKDPRNQGGGFKYFQNYLWAKVFPIELKDNVWDKLAFIIDISDGSMHFHIMGIGAHQSNEASLNASRSSRTELDSTDLSYNTIVYEFEKFYQAHRPLFMDTMARLGLSNDPKADLAMSDRSTQQTKMAPLNQILDGPPGTGKTYHTINKAIAIINPDFDLSQSRDIVKAEYKRLVDSGQIVFTTFHQSLSYEDFVEGIKPLIDEDADGNKQVIYDVQPGILKQIVDRMAASKTDASVESSYTFDDGWNDLIELAFQEQSGLNITQQTFARILYDRKTIVYKRAIEIAELLLLNYYPDISRGRRNVLALMFDMNALWERFVLDLLRKKMRGYKVSGQVSKKFWKSSHLSSNMRPDIVLTTQDGNRRIVLDTKWKNLGGNAPSADDLRQMYVYHEYFNAEKVGLIYPGESSNTSGQFYLKDQTALDDKFCHVLQIPVNKDFRLWKAGVISAISHLAG